MNQSKPTLVFGSLANVGRQGNKLIETPLIAQFTKNHRFTFSATMNQIELKRVIRLLGCTYFVDIFKNNPIDEQNNKINPNVHSKISHP